MKDLIDLILRYLPRYFIDLGSLISGPKKFIAGQNIRTPNAINRSLLFLGISLVLVVIGRAPLLSEDASVWTQLAALGIASVIGVALTALALRISWRIVGGKSPFRSFFIVHSYCYGALIIIITIFQLIGLGILKFFNKDLFEALITLNSQKLEVLLMDSVPGEYWSFLAIIIVGFLVASVWGFIAWGAYRELNALSQIRSFFAIVIAGFLTIPVSVVVFFLAGFADP